MTHYTYPITIEKEGKQYYAYSEDLPGVYGTGASIEDAKTSILEAIRIYILQCKKAGRPVPAARTVYSETVSVAID
jgi:predicted RNase H-like HicB family nuclease